MKTEPTTTPKTEIGRFLRQVTAAPEGTLTTGPERALLRLLHEISKRYDATPWDDDREGADPGTCEMLDRAGMLLARWVACGRRLGHTR